MEPKHTQHKKKKPEVKCGCAGNSIVRSKGEFTVFVRRNTFTIAQPLPYCIWGAMYLNANFSQAIQPYLPVGVTCFAKINGGIVTFTYTSGLLSDSIDVFGNPDGLLSYPEMVANLNTNYLKTELVNFGLNASIIAPIITLTALQIKTLQIQPLYLQKIGGMSSKDNEMISPLTRKLPNNSVNDIIEISMRNQIIKPETFWVHQFANVVIAGNRPLINYFNVFINDIINMNADKMSLSEIREKAELH